jgi:hypothetical protein
VEKSVVWGVSVMLAIVVSLPVGAGPFDKRLLLVALTLACALDGVVEISATDGCAICCRAKESNTPKEGAMLTNPARRTSPQAIRDPTNQAGDFLFSARME